MKKFDVLPSEPRNFRFSNIGTNLGLLHWDSPLKLGDSVSGYVVHYRNMDPTRENEKEITVRTTKNTFVLEDLMPDSSYEVIIRYHPENQCPTLIFQTFVGAENEHGVGDYSTRIVFRTAKTSMMDQMSKLDEKKYDHQQCCKDAKVDDTCKKMFLCLFSNFNINVNVPLNNSLSSINQFHTFWELSLPSVQVIFIAWWIVFGIVELSYQFFTTSSHLK